MLIRLWTYSALGKSKHLCHKRNKNNAKFQNELNAHKICGAVLNGDTGVLFKVMSEIVMHVTDQQRELFPPLTKSYGHVGFSHERLGCQTGCSGARPQQKGVAFVYLMVVGTSHVDDASLCV